MASLFCKALFKPCELCARACVQTCECCGKCCAECGKCTDECCRACNAACAPCCDCLSASCTAITTLCDKPFGGCVIFTFLINFIPFAALIYFLAVNFSNDCDKPLSVWFLILLICFVLNTFFGIYIYRRVSKLADNDMTTHPKWDARQNYSRNTFNITLDFWMNDPWVCMFITLSIFTITWSILGLIWASNAQTSTTIDCSDQFVDASTAAAVIMLVFFGVGLLMIISALCTGYLEHCMNDCNLFHCLCCCLYYPFFYHYDPSFEGQRARQARERAQLRQGQHQQVPNSPVHAVTIQQPQPVMGVPMAQPVYQSPAIVVQSVPQQQYGATGYMAPPQQQQDFQRRSFQSAPVAQPIQPIQQQPTSDVEKAKQKAAAVAEATGEKLKEGAQAFKDWWNKPKEDGPRN